MEPQIIEQVELYIQSSKQHDEKIKELSDIIKKLDAERKKISTELSFYTTIKESQLLAMIHLLPSHKIDVEDDDHSSYYFAKYTFKDGRVIKGSAKTKELAQVEVILGMNDQDLVQFIQSKT